MAPSLSGSGDQYAASRRDLVREIEAEVAATADWTGRDRLDHRVIEAISSVPRHEFVPKVERTVDAVRFRLSVVHSTKTATPPGVYPS